MVPYRDRFFIVTSNALCILENGTIHKLASFPYFNNYDIVIREEEAFVLSSAGIYRVNAEQLAADAVEMRHRMKILQSCLICSTITDIMR